MASAMYWLVVQTDQGSPTGQSSGPPPTELSVDARSPAGVELRSLGDVPSKIGKNRFDANGARGYRASNVHLLASDDALPVKS